MDRLLSKHAKHKNTSPREAVLPLYCSSSAPEAIHHTTHRSRVLHHNGGPNLYKSCVSFVVRRSSLEIATRLRACFSRERSSCAPQCSNLKGFVGTRYLTDTIEYMAQNATFLISIFVQNLLLSLMKVSYSIMAQTLTLTVSTTISPERLKRR